MTAAERAERTAAADALCVRAWESVSGPDVGAALVAVGGYGRSELAPYSDLDVVLVHDEQPDFDLAAVAGQVWYPLWDSGANLDHSVRTLAQMVETAGNDLKVALGLLDVRHVAGDPNLTLRLRTTMLTEWRRDARQRLRALRALVDARHELMGELAHASVPDLKETEGGIRDATVLKALVATWLVDVPHVELERSRLAMLDVRDQVHGLAGRATDRITPEMWSDLAPLLDVPNARAAQVAVRELGRRITHLSRLTWRRVDDALDRATAARRPSLAPVAEGVALAAGEIVLDRRARPAEDPALLLRAAAAAAERDVVLAPPTAARLARECAPLPDPVAGRGARPAGAAARVRPRAARHLGDAGGDRRARGPAARVGADPAAAARLGDPPLHRRPARRGDLHRGLGADPAGRPAGRPDGGGPAPRHRQGQPHRAQRGRRAGRPGDRDPDGLRRGRRRAGRPAGPAGTCCSPRPRRPGTPTTRPRSRPWPTRVGTRQALDLLTVLTEADARAASPKAWSSWRSGLILDLSRRTAAALSSGRALPPVGSEEVEIPEAARQGAAAFSVEDLGDGSRVTVIAPDRVGLLADVSAIFAMQRVRIRAARAWYQDGFGVSVWEVAEEQLQAATLRQTYDGVVEGRLDPASRLRPSAPSLLPPSVDVRPEASAQATVLEVRTTDRPGVVHLVCEALAQLDVTVRSAHVDTLGPQAVDVFYLQEASAGVLSDQRAAAAAHAVRAALDAAS